LIERQALTYRTAFAPVMALVAFSIIASTCWLNTIPSFSHDWSWPFTRAGAYTMISEALLVWHHDSLGHPSYAPMAAALLASLEAMAWALGPLPALRFFLIAIPLVSFFGFIVWVKSMGVPGYRWPTLAALVYACSPVFYNKVLAGHTFYLVAYAITPCVLAAFAAALRGRARRYLPLGGLFAALTASQVQLGVALVAPLGLMVALRPSRRAISLAVALLALGAFIHLPDVLVAVQPESRAEAAQQATPIAWLVSQSQSPLAAAGQSQYIGGYADGALARLPFPFPSCLASLAALVLGLSAVAAGRLGVGAVALTALGITLVSAQEGPLGGIEAWLFASSPYASIFREAYDLSVLVSLGIGLAVACAYRLPRWPRALCIACAALILFRDASTFIMVPPRAALDSAAAGDLKGADADRETAFLPAGFGLRADRPGGTSTTFGGVDSFAQALGHTAGVVYDANPFALSEPLVDERLDLLKRYGIGTLIVRRTVHSVYPDNLDPYSAAFAHSLRTMRPEQPLPYRETFRAQNLLRTTSRYEIALVPAFPTPSQQEVISPILRLATPIPHVDIGVNPSSSWTAAFRWLPAVPELRCLPEPSYFRINDVARYRVVEHTCDWRWTSSGDRSCLTLRHPGIEAAAGCVSREQLLRSVEELRQARQNNDTLIVFAQRNDDRWSLSCPGISPIHVLVDGALNGWLVPRASCARDVKPRFADDPWFGRAVALVWVSAVLLAFCAPFMRLR
jgi:hypothetical protein